ncbi:acetolactate synthase [Spirochaetia bacterium]|nr:acetolactate synthase [Spirochaetia bacterium]
MKVSDYIIEFLISKKVTEIFGYPGGVICHVMDSVTKYRDKITAHALYHEQACAFAACSYAQAAHNIGIVFATSGPGATNLITGIANAFYDSIPIIVLTGNVDTYGVKGDMNIRQRGFQETDFVSIVRSITKYSVFVKSPDDIRYCLEEAYYLVTTGRPGPVVLDLPADVQRADVDPDNLKPYKIQNFDSISNKESIISDLIEIVKNSKRPCFLAGAAVKQTGNVKTLRQLCEQLNVPLVTSMPAVDVFPGNHRLNGGFIGTNGHRYANFIISKSDLVIVIGSRLDLKQVGNKREKFAPNAKLYRIDIDEGELAYKIRNNEIAIHMDISVFLKSLVINSHNIKLDTEKWINVCNQLKEKLKDSDKNIYHDFIKKLSSSSQEGINIIVDTGQSSVWVPQSFIFKKDQNFFISAGLGSMGYSLPAAIGAYYANKQSVICFNGDAGIQMNIQELEFVVKEQLPITIVILNNRSMGMIRNFQEKNFNKNYYLTTVNSGYAVPDFERIAYAYNIKYKRITSCDDLKNDIILNKEPSMLDVQFETSTYLVPNFRSDGPLDDMEPLIDRALYSELMAL